MLERLKREPVAVGALVRLVAMLGARYGFSLTADEVLGVLALVEVVVLPLVRQRVSPVETPP